MAHTNKTDTNMIQTDDIEKLKRKRSTLRSLTTKLIGRVETVFAENTETKLDDLIDLQQQLLEKMSKLDKLNNEIENLLETDLIEADVETSEEYFERALRFERKIDRYLKKENTNNSLPVSNLNVNTSPTNLNEHSSIKYPKLLIKPYFGDPCRWLDFWGQFESAIHNSNSLNMIDKFNYLKSLCGGSALNAISGLSLTETNYKSAIKILQDRFGRPDLTINAHMSKLLNIEPVKSSSNIFALRKLYDECEVNIRSLEALNVTAGSYGHLLCPVLLKILPEDLVLEYNRKRKSKTEFDAVELIEFLRIEIQCRESALYLNSKKSQFQPTRKYENKANFRSTTTTLTTNIKDYCIFCNGNHDCFKCNNISIQDKISKLKAQGRCFKCFKRSHLSINCRVIKNACNKCAKSHHESLCFAAKNQINKPVIEDSNSTLKQASESDNGELTVSSVNQSNLKTVLLQTCSAILKSEKGSKLVKLLFDSASHRSFVTQRLVKEQNLQIVRKETLEIVSFGSKKASATEYEIAKFDLQNVKNPALKTSLEAIVVEKITKIKCAVPSEWLKRIAIKNGVEFTNFSDKNADIDILIGSDFFWEIANGKTVRLSKRLVASDTLFGFTISGMIDSFQGDKSICMNNVCVDDEFTITKVLRNLWELEAIGINKVEDKTSIAEIDFLDTFEHNTVMKNNRYETKLLWKSNRDKLRDNYKIAENSLIWLRNRLIKNPELLYRYTDIIHEQLKEGIIEECKYICENENMSYYMPHREIVREEKSTKVRIVYNASSKGKNEVSLNDCVWSGPNLNPDLFEIILKFRKYAIAFCSDIEKAFHQISLALEDRDFLRFLWINDGEKGIRDTDWKIFRMTRVPFGVTCSPFLLSATIRLHLKAYENENPDVCKMLKQLYVDDLIYGFDTVEGAYKLSVEADRIMSNASMKLRKWETNSKELKNRWKQIGLDTRTSNSNDIPLKVLGMVWNNEADVLKLDLSPLFEEFKFCKNTKRGVLSIVAKVFDPLGLINPYTIRMKCLLQELWERGMGWDDELPPDLKFKWTEWCSEFKELENISIPRQYFHGNLQHTSCQLCIFSDASTKAYGIVAYFRFPKLDSWDTVYILSKTRVAPLKRLTLPRLELMGAVIAARVADYLKRVFQLNSSDIYLWSDSEICLHWIKGTAKMWKPFVSNRALEIQEKTDPENWRFCRGIENPADKLTRGMKPTSFIFDELYWKGPLWLSQPISTWKTMNYKTKISSDELLQEKRILKEKGIVCMINENYPSEDFTSKFSSWTKLRRVIAWCLRFSKRSSPHLRDFLSIEELKRSTDVIIRRVQLNQFPKEINCLTSGKKICGTSKIISLNPFLDENGILRVGGRLNHAEVSENQKHPIIMPKQHHVTDLIIKHYHEIHLHGGTQLLLSAIRQTFWIINGKEAVRKFIWKCVRCSRLRAETSNQLMANLPKSRVTPSRVFSKIGVDFAGPFQIKMKRGRGIRSTKCYVCLFVCFSTKAIHLEIVCDLSTDAFVASLRRFSARRGKPQEISSDCGTNFVGADKELRKMIASLQDDESLQNYLTTDNIKWNFNPPAAPHHGGLWEAGIKSMKYHLKRVMGIQILSYEEFLTLLLQVEACLNSRPITPVSTDPTDLTALTPGHFIIGAPLTDIPQQNLMQMKISPLKRWQLVQQMMQSFWKRWSVEYLSQLQQRVKWQRDRENIEVNDLCVIKEDNQPPLKWKMGRVIEIYPGMDNKVRVVKLKTFSGELKRPITKLSRLPVYD